MEKANSLYWVFRISNPVTDDIPGNWPAVQYCVWQKEKASSGLIHLQGYVVFTQKKRLQWLKGHCDKAAHWESRKGTHEQAKAYSTKEDTRVDGPWESGEEPGPSEQGKRNDLLTLKRKLDAGATEGEVASDQETFPIWAKYWKCIPRYRTLTGKQRDWPVFTQVIWGRPGIGKTWKARDLAGPTAFWLSRPAGQTVWWDGYIGQDTIVIDEFYGWIPLDMMCRLLDRYPLNVETKGGSTPMQVKKVIITSNVAPAEWYKNLPPSRTNALFRRLEMPLGTIEQMLTPYRPVAQAPAPLPPVSLACDEVIDWERFAEEAQRAVASVQDQAQERHLSVAELAGDHIIPVIPREMWEDMGW